MLRRELNPVYQIFGMVNGYIGRERRKRKGDRDKPLLILFRESQLVFQRFRYKPPNHRTSVYSLIRKSPGFVLILSTKQG